MQNALRLPLLALLLVGTSSCVVRIGGGSSNGASSYVEVTKSKSPAQVAFDNRKNLACLTPGMRIAEVLEVMEEGRWGTSSSSKLTNPHRRESFPMADGGQADILYFYTDTRKEDGLVSEEELTPVYFEDGQLVGWGPFAFDTWRERILGL